MDPRRRGGRGHGGGRVPERRRADAGGADRPAFHVQVWKALLRIPAGRTASYGEVAAWAGKPGAFRAAGAAIGANPISWLIPCHRAIARDGRLTGYHWGLARKAAMLGTEAVRASQAA